MSLSTDDFDFIRKLLQKRSAILLEPGKEYLVESRMMSLLHREGISTIENLVQKMRTGLKNGLEDRVVDALTTNETSFFRDIHPFETLKAHVMPQVIEKNKKSKQFGFWCGASSSGQEPFTIGMILRDRFPELRQWKIDFIASDISTEMLERCRRGIFTQLEVNRGLPAQYLIKFFDREGADWKLKDDVKNLINFRHINLAANLPLLPKMDIIFLRNVLIYFDVETKKMVLERIRRVMNPGGFLFLGAAETTLNLDTSFERLPHRQSGCYQLKG